MNVDNPRINTLNPDFILKSARLILETERFGTPEYFNIIFDLLSEIIPYQYATLFLLNHEKEAIELVASKGEAIDLIEMVHFEYGRGFSAWVAKERRPILLTNLHRMLKNERGFICSFLSIPLLVEGKMIGVLNFGNEKNDAYKHEDLPLVKIVVSFLAGMIARNQFVERLEQRNRALQQMNAELERTRDELVKTREKAAISATIVSLNHEINNPLMIILSNLSFLEEFIHDPVGRGRLQIIEGQLERIRDVLKKLREIEAPYFEKYIEGNELMVELTSKKQTP